MHTKRETSYIIIVKYYLFPYYSYIRHLYAVFPFAKLQIYFHIVINPRLRHCFWAFSTILHLSFYIYLICCYCFSHNSAKIISAIRCHWAVPLALFFHALMAQNYNIYFIKRSKFAQICVNASFFLQLISIFRKKLLSLPLEIVFHTFKHNCVC